LGGSLLTVDILTIEATAPPHPEVDPSEVPSEDSSDR
jgi:hypothetical protein